MNTIFFNKVLLSSISHRPEQADLQGGATGAFQALSKGHGEEQRGVPHSDSECVGW